MNFDHLRQLTAMLREVPLETVLIYRGAVRDRCDKSKWHTEQGPLSVTGSKFTNWQGSHGGGGAIDLVMHLAGLDFAAARGWLEQHLAAGHLAAGGAGSRSLVPAPSVVPGENRPLQLPLRDDRLLSRVRAYLTVRRHLSERLLDPLVKSGKLYADGRGNTVFVMVAGKANRPVGAELRGTGQRIWRGMAPGTRKDRGYFWVGATGSRQIVLCESAIDAISCYQLQPDRICISTAGVRANPGWLAGLIGRGYEVSCGFDADVPGDAGAEAMIALHHSIHRLRPPAHDWNDALASG
jgi:hypothetical protein